MASEVAALDSRTRLESGKPGSLVLGLDEVSDTALTAVGGKAANLALLLRSGLRVPRAFCVTTAAFDLFLASVAERTRLAELWSQCSADRLDRIADLSREAQTCLASTSVPAIVREAVLAKWNEFGATRSFAVRSSATVEDATTRSFAGQFESILNVRGADALLDAIRSCWQSLFSERALTYQAKQRIPFEQVKMAVLVQDMVDAHHSGVLFSADPLTGATDRLVVEWVDGTGERLVQGTVQPRQSVLDKKTGRVLSARTHEPPQPSAARPARPDCGERGPAGDELIHAASLSAEILARLCDFARRVEELFGAPQDIEWAERNGELFLLQARPITARMREKTWEERQVWTNLNTGEVAPDVTTSFTWSMIQSLLQFWFASIVRLVGADLRRAPPAGLVAGRIYFNANTLLAAAGPFARLLKKLPLAEQAFGGGRLVGERGTPLTIPPEDLPDLGFRWPKYLLSIPRLIYDLITHSPRRADAWITRMKCLMDERVGVNVDNLSASELADYICGSFHETFLSWDLLYLVTQGAALPVFRKACHDWLDDPDLTLGYRLFAGLGGMPTVEAGLGLWRLATLAHADAETDFIVRSGKDWPQARAALERSVPGREFLASWEAFMNEHGHHCRGELELANARWAETPDYILDIVRGYLRSLGQSNPLESQRRLADERERLTRQCLERLRNPIKRWIFSRSLRRAQKLAVHREELKNLGVRQIAFGRRLLLAAGRRLREHGILCRDDDIFFLELSELKPVAEGNAPFNWRDRIDVRRREYEENLRLTPPRVVVGRFDPDATHRPAADAGAKCLRGIAVSPGIVTGAARVILRADDHEQVLPGEILVAPFTDPAWTPYFVTAAGVVMDQGGILSHGSIIAREYGLPAVTNVGSATRLIRTGDRVQVDGNAGRVTVVGESSLKCAS